jgi:putative membrane-bound dehydrogenase-like protein
MSRLALPLALLASLPFQTALRAATPANVHEVGVAAVDVTPRYNVRLSGFGFRRAESEGVSQRIWAKALAFGKDRPAVVLAVDNLGVPEAIVTELARRLAKKGVTRDRLAVTATHTHTAPMLTGACPTLFGVPIPKDHQARIDRYTREFTDNLEKAALAALADRHPARLSWGIGQVTFALNRRTRGGPVDHDLPLLVVRDLKGKVRALWVNYACHAVTLSHNKIGGDWPGHAQVAIQDDHPGAVALVAVGCGADSNPSSGVTGDKVEVASRQGMEVAREIKRLLAGYLAPVTGPLTVASRTLQLPLADLPGKEEWQKRANRKDAVGHHARVQLDRLARGEKLRTKIDYRVTTWAFGDSLALAFLPGEVVVDYALRLKKELDGRRLWINAYSNDAPCYIPSERVLKEGGYEGGGAMVYYDVPGPFRPGLEKKIIGAVHAQLGKRFAPPFDPGRTGGTLPLSPQRSLAALVAKKGLTIDLVAAEPLIASPVAIDFGPDGRLWVAEMVDYPSGTKGDFQPGGRVAVLEDTDGDGVYDKATVFLDKIPFPTGLTVWRKGVLICAAPDILYAEDTDGDGKADKVTKLFSGFGTQNYQGRVNSLSYGLDGWVHGSCGLFGGTIRNGAGKAFALGDRDFRLRPDRGVIEAAAGRTQQGLARDDWGNWFGCDNSTLARHYVLPDHYLRRNPHLAYPDPAVFVPGSPDASRLFPLRPLQLFALSGPAGRATAACGLGVYRDDLLGKEYTGNLFTCEPVNLAVHRVVLQARGSTFSGRRADDEKDREFLASTDGWFRPVQARTGPDGGLWVVDMYRFVIEHPRWIPREELAKLDLRAGATMGRIYRVRPAGKPLRKPPRLDKATARELVGALDSPNGPQRDLAGQILLWKGDASAAPALVKLASSRLAEARLHALCVLDGLGKLTAEQVRKALADEHPGVRRHAVRLAEGRLEALGPDLFERTADGDPQVRLQLAFTLGAWRDARAAKALAALASENADDPYLVAAVLSSVGSANVAGVAAEVLKRKSPPVAVVQKLLALAAALGDKEATATALAQVTTADGGRFTAWQFAALAGILDALERRKQAVPDMRRVRNVLARARQVAEDASAKEAERLAAVGLLGREAGKRAADVALLGKLLAPRNSPALQSAALQALARVPDDSVAATLLAGWKGHTPSLRGQVLDLLPGRPAWLARLLTALEKNEISPGRLDAARRQRLLTHKDEKVRKRAAKIFAVAGSRDRQKVLKEHAGALALAGNVARGKTAFARHCAACHRLEGVGHEVGPDLAAAAAKTPAYLLGEILDPNRNLDSRYLQYTVTTTRGLTYVGLLAAETATSLTLKLQEGKTQSLLRSEVEELTTSGQSLMPEGLEKDLSKQDLADLLAYLTRQKKPKSFPGNRPATVRAARGGYALPATACAIYGGDICFEAPFRNIGCWHGADDHVVWAVEVNKGATFDVWLDWSCDGAVAGNRFVLEGGTAPLGGTVKGTGGWDRYRQALVGQLTLAAGQQRLTFRPDGPLRGALLDLRGVHLVPVGTKPAFAAKPAKASPAELARQVLDDKLPAARRQALINESGADSAELLAALVADLKPGGKEEYRRIPWVWRVAIAAGKRNDAAELKKLLDVALPKADGPLLDWQAVVLGGGLVNGISLAGGWPAQRMKELLEGSKGRAARWKRAVDEASRMADNAGVPAGTRYDALRMIALEGFEKRGEQLKKYLTSRTNDELTMGAISGLSDIDSEKVAPLLLAGLEHFSAGNRKLALEALLRTEGRALALLAAVEAGKVRKAALSDEQQRALWKHPSEKVRRRALKALGEHQDERLRP